MFRIIFLYISLVFLVSSCQLQGSLFKNKKPSDNTNTNTLVKSEKHSKKEFADMFNEANSLIAIGEVEKAENILQKTAPYYQPSAALLKRLEAPFNMALKSVETYIRNWLLRPSEIAPIQLKKPTRPILPQPEVITKGEFETTKQFNIKLAQKKAEYNNKLYAIKQNYINKIDVYNTAITSYNSEIHWEEKIRQEQILSMRPRLLNIAVNEVLGTPKMINVKYNADKEVFDARVVASSNIIYYDIVIPVVMSEAKDFKKNIGQAEVFIKMNLDGKIKPVNFKIQNLNKMYAAYLVDKNNVNYLTKQKSAGVASIDLNNIEIDKINTLKVNNIINSNKKFFKKLF